jgi:S-formylglutathione hydrolase FrmB
MTAFARRRVLSTLLSTLLVATAAISSSAVMAAPGAARLSFHDTRGIHVVAAKRLDPRQWNVKVLSPALGRAVNIRILLPNGYDPKASRRYPVLYLFHGTSGGASDWVVQGNAEATTEHLPLITVMPDAGFDFDGGGWFTDWVDRTTALGPSQWETFHVDDVIPWVDANLRTIRGRQGRAIAGLSQGGFGSTTYAARHPDLFGSVASFSGAPEIARDPDVTVGATAVIYATAYGLDGVQPEAMFGSRVTNAINWAGHDPASLIDNLRATAIHLWTATGADGPYDPQPNPGASGIEFLTHASTLHFHDHLVEADVPSDYHDYTYGTHSWPYWSRDLAEYVGEMMHDFAHPMTQPSVTYTSIDKTWTQWGWTVSFDRAAAQEWSELSYATARAFTLTGSGTATVVTPPSYRPGSVVGVTQGGKTHQVRIGRDGRLRVVVQLGSATTTATVTIAAP